ncbi:hypothetical protein MMC17_004484 [Xylographa soralifera]|nr:hypothetical protein [Xylographa soralifera]
MPEHTDPTSLMNDLTHSITTFNGLGEAQVNGASVEAKERLIHAAKDLFHQVESPEDAIFQVAFGGHAQAALGAALEMGLFEAFQGQDEASLEELTQRVEADSVLVARIMRALVAVGFFHQTTDQRYALNRVSRRFMNPSFRTLIMGFSGVFSSYLPSLPEYLASISFQNPSDPRKALFQFATGTDANFFEWLHSQPKQFERFTSAMAVSSAMGNNLAQETVLQLLPDDETALYSEESSSLSQQVLLVDVGGGRGQFLNDIRKNRPTLRGRMIVQDLPREIEGRDRSDEVESMAHDFFTPQPVMGACIYYFRHIFHDWPDSACHCILKQTMAAMRRGHSRIVIVDFVLPGMNAPLFWSLLDISMMTLGGMERTQAQWRTLLEGVGLHVVRVEEGPGGRDGLVEAVLS